MRRTRFAVAVVIFLLLSIGMGCQRPSDRDIALDAYASMAMLYAALVAATAVGALIYRRIGRCSIPYAWRWHLVAVGVWSIVSVLAIHQLEPAAWRGVRSGIGAITEYSLLGFLVLGPVTLLLANILAKVVVLRRRLRLYPFIPLVLTLGIAIVFLEPLIRNDFSSATELVLLVVLSPFFLVVGFGPFPMLVTPAAVVVAVALVVSDVLLAQWIATRARGTGGSGTSI